MGLYFIAESWDNEFVIRHLLCNIITPLLILRHLKERQWEKIIVAQIE